MQLAITHNDPMIIAANSMGQDLSQPKVSREVVVYLDSRSLTRDSIGRCLAEGLAGWRILALPTLADGAAALRDCDHVAIVLLNIAGADIHDTAVADEVATLQQALPEVPFAFVAENDAYDAIVAALRIGARGYLPTSLPSAVVAEAVRLICAGGTYAPLRSLLPMSMTRPEQATLDATRQADYSARQLQILQCLRRGLANKQIAFELGMSEGTVKVHVRKLMRKARAQNRTQLVMQTMAMPLKY